MSKSKIIITTVVVAVGVLAGISLLMRKSSQTQSSENSHEILGYFRQNPIRLSDLSPQEKQSLFEAQNQVYHTIQGILSKKYLDSKIQDFMKEKKISSVGEAESKFMAENIKVSDSDISAFIQKNSENPSLKGKSKKDQEGMIRPYLMKQAAGDFFANLSAEAESKSEIKVASQYIPTQPVLPIEIGKSPIRGNANAKVTIVEFSDFQCPYCEKSESLLKDIMTKYDGKVRLVYKHFPLSFHNQAMNASIASECANQQNKFWEMHDAIFENQSKLSDALYANLAKNLKLDGKKFETCFKNPATHSQIQEEVSYGQSLSVSGTPAFYINGKQVMPVASEFKSAIEKELK